MLSGRAPSEKEEETVKTALAVIGILVVFGLLVYGLSFFWAWWEQRQWDRMDVDEKLRRILENRGGKL